MWKGKGWAVTVALGVLLTVLAAWSADRRNVGDVSPAREELYRVQQYRGGRPAGTWLARGPVVPDPGDRTWSFTDAETGEVVRVPGPVIIDSTEIPRYP
jgi:hypothetical protein